MLEKIFLASYSSYGGGIIGNWLSNWEQAGFFSYALPFLLIFALVYGVLARVGIFGKDNKPINGIIALVVGLMSLQFNIVSRFFGEIFPRMGIALSIILVLLVVAGLFIDSKNKWFMNLLTVVAIFIVGLVVLGSFGGFEYYSLWDFVTSNWSTLLGVILFIGLLVAILFGGDKNKDHESPLRKALLGERN